MSQKKNRNAASAPAPQSPPKRAAFTISISLDPNVSDVPQTHLAVLGDGAAWQIDILTALQKARDNFIAEIVAERVREMQAASADTMAAATER